MPCRNPSKKRSAACFEPPTTTATSGRLDGPRRDFRQAKCRARRAAKESNDVAPVHSITSSAICPSATRIAYQEVR